jgi:DNA/RNA endonuclease YhcR with UshA esterase domain
MPAIIYTGSFSVSFKNEHPIYEHEVRCLVKESDFNLSYNPTLVTNYASGSVKDFATGSNFYTYATALGLYNDNNELLAVAKFGKPMLISPDTDMTFVIKYDT